METRRRACIDYAGSCQRGPHHHPNCLRAFPQPQTNAASAVPGYAAKTFRSPEGSQSTRHACELYLEFAANHPHEYELLSAGWSKPPSVNEQWPSFNLLKERLALRYGGKPDDYTRFAFSVWQLLHGTAMLIVVGKTGKELQLQMRLACLEAIEALGASLEKNGVPKEN